MNDPEPESRTRSERCWCSPQQVNVWKLLTKAVKRERISIISTTLSGGVKYTHLAKFLLPVSEFPTASKFNTKQGKNAVCSPQEVIIRLGVAAWILNAWHNHCKFEKQFSTWQGASPVDDDHHHPLLHANSCNFPYTIYLLFMCIHSLHQYIV